MLQISYIRDNKDLVIKGLKKRNFKELDLVDRAIALDENRRQTQTQLDNTLSESNKLSKEERLRGTLIVLNAVLTKPEQSIPLREVPAHL